MCYICGQNLHLMAKKKDKKEEQAIEPVAICDLKNTDIKAFIRTIRGVEVILDSDLAMLYGVENKRLNEQASASLGV